VTRNVVLVAHSQGGEVATYFVRDDLGLVSGAVLVDADLPRFFTDPEIARLVAATKPQVDAAKAAPSTRETRQLLATAAGFVPVQHACHQVSWPGTVPAEGSSHEVPADRPDLVLTEVEKAVDAAR
jgi:pimeloyl-ACP methyl ester carboxylesterase